MSDSFISNDTMIGNGKTYTGVTIFFSNAKGYGFLAWSDENGVMQADIFVHHTDICLQGYRTLYKGQRVTFQVGQNNRQQRKAVNVKIATD